LADSPNPEELANNFSIIEKHKTNAKNTCIAAKYNVNESAIRKWRKAIDVDVEITNDKYSIEFDIKSN
jgi:hypothetical protein